MLHLCGFIEVGKLNAQTVAWRWIAGRGQSRTYQRGYFSRVEQPISLDEGATDKDGRVRWKWLDDLVYREWLNQEHADVSGGVTDGLRRYRSPTVEGRTLIALIAETVEAMPRTQCRLIKATLLRGHSVIEAARLLRLPASIARRLSESGLADLRRGLLREGFGPATTRALSETPAHVVDAA